MSDVPSLDDFSEGIRYRRWDGTQRLDALEAEELLGAMSDELLAGGDLEDALARLSRWGIPGRMDGMKDLLERLRAAKQRRAERHDLSKVFDELKEKLDEVKRLEREGLERRRASRSSTRCPKTSAARCARSRTMNSWSRRQRRSTRSCSSSCRSRCSAPTSRTCATRSRTSRPSSSS